MEILSTGEKIKRSRIYKGFTLKDVCNDKLSVSKLSCIENSKVKPEDSILKYIAKKLDIDYNYLKQDIREQLEDIAIKNENKYENEEKFEGEIQYVINLSEEKQYYDLALRFMHLLFSFYLDNNNLTDLYSITSKYYDFCQKNNDDNLTIIYYLDMAKYLFINKEFIQASNYFNNVKMLSENLGDMKLYAIAIYNEAVCYNEIKDFEKAYELSRNIENLIKYVQDDITIAEMYHILAVLSLILNQGKFKFYEDLSYKYYKNDFKYKAIAMHGYAIPMFDMRKNEEGIKYIREALNIFPRENINLLTEFMLKNVKVLIENHVLDFAEEVCENALNNSIDADDIKLIEKSYYFKALILQMKKEYISAEMYMNLSLDSLVKFGNNSSISKRYYEMGYMYYNLGQVNDSLRYFNLAISIEKNI